MRKLGAERPREQPATLDDAALARFRRGEHTRVHRMLGAHPTAGSPGGTRFAVWAPRASGVRLIGDFNDWDGARHSMRLRGPSGVWELFVPEIGEGARYKYEILTRSGERLVRADPVAFETEPPPGRASVVVDLGRYRWGDDAWLRQRAARQGPEAPASIYEVHLGSWRRTDEGGWIGYRELAGTLLPYVVDLGFTHLELLPVTEHPFDASWGYQTVGYFAPTHRFGPPDDLRRFVDEAHRLGLGVILDWAPAHFPRDPEALARFDGAPLYEHADPRRGEHPDWDTAIFDYGRPEVISFLISSALFWLEEYHADGLRVDAVASMLYLDYSRRRGEWTPNVFGGRENLEALDFLRRLNETVHREQPGTLTIAEESTAWPGVTRPAEHGGLAFDLKWNMGWMNDALRYFQLPPKERSTRHNEITFSILYAFGERYVLPLSHDEVVHLKRALVEKMPGEGPEKFAGLRLLYGYMWAHPGRKLLFMGGEFGQRAEWDHDRELAWELADAPPHRGLIRLVRDLNKLYREEPALHEMDDEGQGFEWIDVHDSRRSVLTFLRWSSEWREFVVVAANLAAREWRGYRLGLPAAGSYEILLNTDDERYGGRARPLVDGARAPAAPSGLLAKEGRCNGRPYHAEITLPPLTALWLKPEASEADD